MITMLVIVVLFFAACSDTQSDASNEDTGEAATENNSNDEQASDGDAEDAPITSKIDGVSDEVYKQLLEFYFYLTTFTDMLIDNVDSEEKSDLSWHKDHELYEEAIEYVESHDEDIYLLNVFPNPLLYEHHENPDNFTEEEAKYIDMIAAYMEASNRMNLKDYTKLKADLKEELQIDEADNMFP